MHCTLLITLECSPAQWDWGPWAFLAVPFAWPFALSNLFAFCHATVCRVWEDGLWKRVPSVLLVRGQIPWLLGICASWNSRQAAAWGLVVRIKAAVVESTGCCWNAVAVMLRVVVRHDVLYSTPLPMTTWVPTEHEPEPAMCVCVREALQVQNYSFRWELEVRLASNLFDIDWWSS